MWGTRNESLQTHMCYYIVYLYSSLCLNSAESVHQGVASSLLVPYFILFHDFQSSKGVACQFVEIKTKKENVNMNNPIL